MTEQEISVKLTETEQRAKSNTHRIEKLEQQQKDLNKLVTKRAWRRTSRRSRRT